jgi:hypothetical protein
MEDQELKEASNVTRHRALTIAEILRGSEYSLTLFSAEEVASLELFDRSPAFLIRTEGRTNGLLITVGAWATH